MSKEKIEKFVTKQEEEFLNEIHKKICTHMILSVEKYSEKFPTSLDVVLPQLISIHCEFYLHSIAMQLSQLPLSEEELNEFIENSAKTLKERTMIFLKQTYEEQGENQ